jgi:hypothetical protein
MTLSLWSSYLLLSAIVLTFMIGYEKSGSDHMADKLTPTHSFAFVSNLLSSVGIFHCVRLVVFVPCGIAFFPSFNELYET